MNYFRLKKKIEVFKKLKFKMQINVNILKIRCKKGNRILMKTNYAIIKYCLVVLKLHPL